MESATGGRPLLVRERESPILSTGSVIERTLSYLNCVGLQVRNTQPSLGCSSEASPQSLSPSQT